MKRARKQTCLWRLHWTIRKRLEEMEDEWLTLTGHELTIYSGADSTHRRTSQTTEVHHNEAHY